MLCGNGSNGIRSILKRRSCRRSMYIAGLSPDYRRHTEEGEAGFLKAEVAAECVSARVRELFLSGDRPKCGAGDGDYGAGGYSPAVSPEV